jgi:hypothetical protein
MSWPSDPPPEAVGPSTTGYNPQNASSNARGDAPGLDAQKGSSEVGPVDATVPPPPLLHIRGIISYDQCELCCEDCDRCCGPQENYLAQLTAERMADIATWMARQP